MEEKKLVPKLRFPGFTEPWEQRTFSELFEYERPDAYIVQSDLYCDEYNVPVLTANKAFILGYTNEECTYNKPSIIFDDFTLDRKYVDFPYMLKSSAIKILTAKENHNLRFLFERLNSTRFEVLGHARHYISVVQNTSTLCPTLDEENCISTILTKVDTLITLHQRKLEHLKLKKKSLLQKLFPKEGEVYPELRFPGFTDPWEQRKFLDLLDAQNGIRRGPFGSALKKESFVKESDYVVYEQQNAIYDNYKTRYFISKEKYTELIRFNIQPGDFIMSGAGTIGRISMAPGGIKKGVFNQALIRFKVDKDSVNPLYFLKFMQSDMMQKQLTQANPGSAMTNLVPMDELKKWDIVIPSLEEQNKISTFINQLDDVITLHQRKLEHLQLLKKALLQQLFV